MIVFLDANIILDIYDNTRRFHKYSTLMYSYLLKNKFKIFTSCDLITAIYYVDSKKDRKQALLNIQAINKILKVIEFSNKEVEKTCALMLKDDNFKDLEETIQYIMAKKYECNLIISNDKNFISKDIKLMSSKEYCEKYLDY